MATFNLVRNTRVFFTTNVNATTGAIPTSGATFTTGNTVELQVMDGFSFKQGTQTQSIELKEAGATPVRGKRTFNTSLDAAEFSFSTYIRPYFTGGVTSAEEQVLWNALMSADAIDTTGIAIATVSAFVRGSTATNVVTFTCASFNLTSAGVAIGDVLTFTGLGGGGAGGLAQEWNQPAKLISITGTMAAATGMNFEYLTAPSAAAGTAPTAAPTALNLRKGAWTSNTAVSPVGAYGQAHFGNSNKNQMQKFGLLFSVDGAIYAVDNCALDQAVIDFGLDGIAMVAWTGKGTVLRQLPSTAVITGAIGSSATFSGAGNATGSAMQINTAAPYITNKLSTMQLIAGIQGSGTAYNIALTGGSITIANGIQYVTPANLGVVNKAIGYFTGGRSITGTVNAYLKTGTNNSAQILSDILTANAAETKFRMQIEIGGLANAVRVELDMDGCMLQVPTVETQDIMSTTIGFTAQSTDALLANAAYDLANTNDMTIRYFSA